MLIIQVLCYQSLYQVVEPIQVEVHSLVHEPFLEVQVVIVVVAFVIVAAIATVVAVAAVVL